MLYARWQTYMYLYREMDIDVFILYILTRKSSSTRSLYILGNMRSIHQPLDIHDPDNVLM